MHLLLFNLMMDIDDPVLGFATDWVNELSEHYRKVTVITVRSGRIDVRQNVSVFTINAVGVNRIRKVTRLFSLLNQINESDPFDVCFSHMVLISPVLAAGWLRRRRIPVCLWFAHGHVSLMLRVAEKLVDRIVTSSPLGCRINSSKIHYIGQGISWKNEIIAYSGRRFDFLETVRLIYVGRISPIKSIDVLIEAMSILMRETVGRRLTLSIVGASLSEADRLYEERLKDKVLEYGLSDCVEFSGTANHRNIWMHYQKNDIFLNASQTGSMDKTVLEAMASGMLCITSNKAFDTSDYLDAGGFYVENSAAAFSNIVVQILSCSSDELQDCSLRSSSWVRDNHSLQSIGEKIAGHLSELKNRFRSG